jgi:hypothetical protein
MEVARRPVVKYNFVAATCLVGETMNARIANLIPKTPLYCQIIFHGPSHKQMSECRTSECLFESMCKLVSDWISNATPLFSKSDQNVVVSELKGENRVTEVVPVDDDF